MTKPLVGLFLVLVGAALLEWRDLSRATTAGRLLAAALTLIGVLIFIQLTLWPEAPRPAGELVRLLRPFALMEY